MPNIWQLTCSGKKKRELTSVYKRARAVVMYTAKCMSTGSLGVGEEAGVWARWQTPTHQPLCVTENWCVGELLNAHTSAAPCGKTDVWATSLTHHTRELSYMAYKIS